MLRLLNLFALRLNSPNHLKFTQYESKLFFSYTFPTRYSDLEVLPTFILRLRVDFSF